MQFFSTPQNFTFTSTGVWSEKDLSAYVPEGTTSAIIRVHTHSTSGGSVGARNTTSSDDNFRTGPLSGNYQTILIAGLDSNRTTDLYQTNQAQSWDIVAYSSGDITLLDSVVDLTPALGGWQEIDCSSYIPANATGAIFLISVTSGAYQSGVRPKGATVNNRVTWSTWGSLGVTGVDANRKCEGYNPGIGAATFYLIGYFTSGISAYANATSRSKGISSWTDITLTGTGSEGAWFTVPTATNFAIRGDGDTYDFTENARAGFWPSRSVSDVCEISSGSSITYYEQGIFIQTAYDISTTLSNWEWTTYTTAITTGSVEVTTSLESWQWYEYAAEVSGLTVACDLVSWEWTTYDAIVAAQLQESITASDSFTLEFVKLLSESLTVSTSWDITTIYVLTESLLATATPSTLVNVANYITQNITISDVLSIIWEAFITENITATPTIAGIANKINLLTDSLLITGTVSSQKVALALIAFALAINDVIDRENEETLSELTTLTDTISSAWLAYRTLLDSIVVTDTTTNQLSLSILLSDSAEISIEDTINQTLTSLLSENISIGTIITIDGIQYYGWVVNTETSSIVNYTNWDFNSLINYNGTYYGAKSDGIYQLDFSDTDNEEEIVARIKLGTTDFNNTNKKRLEQCYLGIRSDEGLYLKTITDEKRERIYKLVDTNTREHISRIKLHKGAEGVFWNFEIENIDGGNLEINSIEFYPMILKRKI